MSAAVTQRALCACTVLCASHKYFHAAKPQRTVFDLQVGHCHIVHIVRVNSNCLYSLTADRGRLRPLDWLPALAVHPNYHILWIQHPPITLWFVCWGIRCLCFAPVSLDFCPANTPLPPPPHTCTSHALCLFLSLSSLTQLHALSQWLDNALFRRALLTLPVPSTTQHNR